MSEYTEVEQPFLHQLATQGWTVIDQGQGIPQSAAPSLREHFRQWLLPGVFDEAVRALNRTEDGQPWLTDRQLDELRTCWVPYDHWPIRSWPLYRARQVMREVLSNPEQRSTT